MAEAIEDAPQGFWHPPVLATSEAVPHPERLEACRHCGTEFIVGSRYCHSCGAARPGLNSARIGIATILAFFLGLGDQLGLSTGAFISFVVGVVCVLGAVAVGVIFSARTVLDWQAVQLWRIEWLLGAVSAFLAGCLLKRAR